MKRLYVLPLLFCVSCVQHPVVTPPPPAPSPITTQPPSSTYTYYFSASMKENLVNVAAVYGHYVPAYVMIDGKQVEYTECTPADQAEPYNKYPDNVRLGTLAGNCTPR